MKLFHELLHALNLSSINLPPYADSTLARWAHEWNCRSGLKPWPRPCVVRGTRRKALPWCIARTLTFNITPTARRKLCGLGANVYLIPRASRSRDEA